MARREGDGVSEYIPHPANKICVGYQHQLDGCKGEDIAYVNYTSNYAWSESGCGIYEQYYVCENCVDDYKHMAYRQGLKHLKKAPEKIPEVYEIHWAKLNDELTNKWQQLSYIWHKTPCEKCTGEIGSWLQTRCEKYEHGNGRMSRWKDYSAFRQLCPDCREIILESKKQGD